MKIVTNPLAFHPKLPPTAWPGLHQEFAPGAELLRAGSAGERMGLSPTPTLSHQTTGNEEEHPIVFPKFSNNLAPRLQPPQTDFLEEQTGFAP